MKKAVLVDHTEIAGEEEVEAVAVMHTGAPDVDGFDSNITHFRVKTSGAFAASNGITDPSFNIRFRVRLQ